MASAELNCFIFTDNPMQPEILAKAVRCGAKTRVGDSCRAPAVRGKKRCRMHGGNKSGAPNGNRNAWKHGDRSAEAEFQLKALSKCNRDLKLSRKIADGRRLTSKEHERLLEIYLQQKAPA